MVTTTPNVMISFIYVSSAVELFSQTELLALLETSRWNNSRNGVTGMLLYKDGNFMQVIEGAEAEIRRLHEKISRDPRHNGLITLMERRIEQRQFSDWSMGFRNLSDPGLQEIPGYSDFLNVPLTSGEFSANPSRAEKLLLAFKQKM